MGTNSIIGSILEFTDAEGNCFECDPFAPLTKRKVKFDCDKPKINQIG